VWPVSRGCLLLLRTWSYLRICRTSVLPYTRFCNCLLNYSYVLHIVNFILYINQTMCNCTNKFKHALTRIIQFVWAHRLIYDTMYFENLIIHCFKINVNTAIVSSKWRQWQKWFGQDKLYSLRFYVPLKNISPIWRRHHCRWRAAKFRPMLDAQGHWAGRDLYCATPAATRDLGFFGLIRRTAPFCRLLRHTRGCGGSILTRILTGRINYIKCGCDIDTIYPIRMRLQAMHFIRY
jgi:hypothetical protein